VIQVKGRSVGIVRLRTKTTEFVCLFVCLIQVKASYHQRTNFTTIVSWNASETQTNSNKVVVRKQETTFENLKLKCKLISRKIIIL
jgi:hypothetical protein